MPCLLAGGCETCDVAADDVLIERLLRVIDEGRRTATYKLALIMLALVPWLALKLMA